jgi:amylosucrase
MSRDVAIADRVARRWDQGVRALQGVYGEGAMAVAERARAIAVSAANDRSDELFALDEKRGTDPGWFLGSSTVGYVCYVDRFGGTLEGVAKHLTYLADLGVTYLHLMPLLRPRPGENDGGYAVMSYDEVDPSIGSMDDLVSLATALRRRGMSLCVDLVLNHTAKEHEWAQKAAAGDPTYRSFYRIFPDRTEPDQYERTLREVFPDFSPGNFSPLSSEWVWTTFNEYQWDLNYENPDVFCAMLEIMCRLANRGVDVLRLDAVPFLWKRLGTDCENQPEAHALLAAFRAFVAIAAPAVVFKAEAIVPPDLLVPYLGTPAQPECDIAYHNQLMVLLWSSLATRDGALMTNALRRMTDLPAGASWVTYVRCHDDIGWAIDDADARGVGWDGWSHRKFLSDFYSGAFAGSFGRGALFQHNPVTGDARISGTAASLCGIDAALEGDDAVVLARAVARLELVYAVAFSFGGIPLLYMGDELALCNDHGYRALPDLAPDNRWMHRPSMDWDAAERRAVAGTIEHTVFTRLRSLSLSRAACPVLRSDNATRLLSFEDRRLFGFERSDGAARFVMVANFSDDTVAVNRNVAGNATHTTLLGSGAIIGASTIDLPACSYAWLTT